MPLVFVPMVKKLITMPPESQIIPGPAPVWMSGLLRELASKNEIDDEKFERVMAFLTGETPEMCDAMAILSTWAARGERVEDFTRGARFLRAKMRQWCLGDGLMDTCGTGGDGASTFNISTVVGLVIASCGVRVVKHGNRAQSGTSGSTDLLGHWKIGFPGGQEQAFEILSQCGIVFCHAIKHHPCLAGLAPIRRRLGIRTLFNGLGPLCNPSSPKVQMIGVGFPDWVDPYARALAALGTSRGLVIHGNDGLDEISLGAKTTVRYIHEGTIEELVWEASDFGLPNHSTKLFRVNSVMESAAMADLSLSGKDNPPRHIVLANAGAGLWLFGKAPSLLEGVEMAAKSIDSGKPGEILETLRSICPAG